MRLQLALNVDDLDEAIGFYSKMFDSAPDKIRPGYANFAIADPPLKLVLFAGAGAPGSINHLGVEVDEAAAVTAAAARLASAGLEATEVQDTTCCFAEKTESWLEGPDATRWEWYVKNADSEAAEAEVLVADDVSSCCAPAEVNCC